MVPDTLPRSPPAKCSQCIADSTLCNFQDVEPWHPTSTYIARLTALDTLSHQLCLPFYYAEEERAREKLAIVESRIRQQERERRESRRRLGEMERKLADLMQMVRLPDDDTATSVIAREGASITSRYPHAYAMRKYPGHYV